MAYCAGVIDSDGTIGIKRSTYGMRHDNGGQPTYSERVCVKQVEPDAVELLHRLFGGYRFVSRASATRGRPLEGWQVTDVKAATALRALLPYLRIKRRQAENCLVLRALKDESKRVRVAFGRGHVGSARRPEHISEAMAALTIEAHALNAVGV